MIHALVASIIVALLLTCLVRAAQPGMLLARLSVAWMWWIIFRPGWLPRKPSGGCVFCTCFWVPGVPVAVAVLLLTPPYFGAHGWNWWAVTVPFLVAILSESFIEQVS